jgi:hypothetical protein
MMLKEESASGGIHFTRGGVAGFYAAARKHEPYN